MPFLVQSIPGQYRREPLVRDHFYLEANQMLPNGDWCVAFLIHSVAHPRKPELSRYDFHREIVGAVAVNVQSGKALFLRSQRAAAGDANASVIIKLRPLAVDSCAITSAQPSDLVGDESEIFLEQATVWKWTLPTGKFTQLGANVHVRNLALALDQTPYNATWPMSFRRDWDGKVALVDPDGKTKQSLKTVDTSEQKTVYTSSKSRRWGPPPDDRRAPGDLDEFWSSDR